MKKVILGILGLLTVGAMGAEVGTYALRFDVGEAGNLVSRSQRGRVAIGGGWNCEMEASQAKSRILQDHTGKTKILQESTRLPTGYSLLANPMFFTTLATELDPSVESYLEVTEKCEECHTDIMYTPDGNGNLQPSYYTTCSHASLGWTCGMNDLPKAVGQSGPGRCRLTTRNLSSQTPAQKLHFLEKATPRFSATLESKRESYAADLCGGRSINRSVLSLSQGVAGHWGEKNFHVFVKVGDGKPVDIATRTGLLHQDILLCPETGRVRVKVWAVVNNLLFEHKYKPVGPEGVEFQVGGGKQTAVVELRRKSFTGITPRQHFVRLQFEGKTPSMYGEAPARDTTRDGFVAVSSPTIGVHNP